MMGYIHELRKMVGTYPVIAIGATIIVFNIEGEILLQRRSDTDTWGLPGGLMEPGETPEETARRELYEETGLKADKLKLINVFSGPEFFFIYPNGDQMNTVIILYEALRVNGELRINDEESRELKFFNINKLPEMESRAAAILKRLEK